MRRSSREKIDCATTSTTMLISSARTVSHSRLGGMSMAAVPPQIDPGAVRAFLVSRAGVVAVHDLHIWGMSTTETALTAHLVFPEGFPGDAKRVEI